MHRKLLAATGALLAAPLFLAMASPATQLVVFGDSLSDNGNFAYYAPLFLGQTLASANYAANAFTDGPNTSPATSGPYGVWIDQFAAKVGIADPMPAFTPAVGSNYAFAGTNTAPGNNPGLIDTYDISNQVAAFSLSHLGSAPSSALYTIWGGANDLFNGVNDGKTAADNLYKSILGLAGEGAKNFLWLNLPDLGETPRGKLQGAAALTTQSTDFDDEWAVDLATLKSLGINVIGVDMNALFNGIMKNPLSYGFTDVMDPAQGTSGNPNASLFWDTEHPTTAADTLIADAAFAAYTAPEPLSAGLSVLGLIAVLTALKVRRKPAVN